MTPAELFNKYALSYSEKFMDVSQYADTLDVFCNGLPASAKVLDIACGPGNIAKYLLNKHPDMQLTGIDLAPDMLVIAKSVNPGATFRLMDCRDIASIREQFAGIMCAFCLPYLDKKDTIQLLCDAANMLADNGVMYISAMEGRNNESAYSVNSAGDRMFINYHEVDYLCDTLTANRCDVIDIRRMTSPGNTSLKTNDVIIIAHRVTA